MLFHEKVAYSYFQKLFSSQKKLTDAFHRLNEYEQKQIRKIERKASIYAGIFGTLGVVLLYLPVHLKPDLFPFFYAHLPWLGQTPIPWAYTLYMVLLAIAEIFALTWLNLVTVYGICRICGFPTSQDEYYDIHIQALFEASLDKSNKKLLNLGINPLAGMPAYTILFFSVLFILKATLSNLLMKFLLRRVFSRLAIVGYAYYVDYMSILIFAGWNIYATHVVITSAKVRIMAPNLIVQLVTRLHHEFKENAMFKDVVLEMLQFIAMAKRNFHHNHYLLAESIISRFSLPRQNEIKIKRETILSKINSAPVNVKQGLAKLFILGILIDGKVSQRELQILTILRDEGVCQLPKEKLLAWEQDFIAGRGLDELFQKGVPL